jgi:hypothetical protein
MAVWLSYSLTDLLLFSPQTYYRLLELYHRAVWPAQLAALAVGFAILGTLLWPSLRRSRIAAGLLAGCWLWVAWAFHLERYSTINWAAGYMAAAFAFQALLLLWTGTIRGKLGVARRCDPSVWAGVALFGFALLAQPWIGLIGPRTWPEIELFGMTPDATATATLGLLLTAERVPWTLLVIPCLWCLVGAATLWAMAAPDAWVTLLVAALCLIVATARGFTAASTRQPTTSP